MRVIVSGGGTGGHIYPALSIIREVQKREPDSEFLYIGTEKGLEADIVGQTDIPFETVHITGFKRQWSLENIKTIFRFLKGVRRSKKIIRRFSPDIVVGTGGYVSGPVVYAASRLKIPALVHEQNVVPGLTNVFLSRFTQAVAVSFQASVKHFTDGRRIELTGNPRASEVVQADGEQGIRSLGIPPNKKVILVVGGSRGAEAINRAFLDMADRIDRFADCHFVYVTGDIHYDHICHELTERKAPMEKMTVQPFVYNMPDVLAATDLIINRAGASFLAEITALGIPAILIPSPYVTNNHQEKNARWLEKEGAARVILERDLDGKRLFETIAELLADQERIKHMKRASARLGQTDAAAQIYQLMKKLVHQKN